MKKLLSLLMICSVVGSTTYSNKAEAGVILAAAGAGMLIASSHDQERDLRVDQKKDFCYEPGKCIVLDSNSNVSTIRMKVFGVFTLAAGGSMAAFFGAALAGGITAQLLPVAVALVVLEEDGSLPEGKFEHALAERYPFIKDKEVISELVSQIKTKSEGMEEDEYKRKFVGLEEKEVRSVLDLTDLSEEHIQQVIVGLK